MYSTPTAPKDQSLTVEEKRERFAKALGLVDIGANGIDTMMNSGGMIHVGGFTAFYNAGRSGKDIQEVKSIYADYLTPEQQEMAYNSGRMDAIVETSNTQTVEKSGQTSYTRTDPGISALSGQLAIRDVATVNGIKYSLRQNADGQYVLNIDRDTAAVGGYIDNARSHIYDVGPFATRGEAVQKALDIGAESGGMSIYAHGYAATGNNKGQGTGAHQGGSVRTAPGGVNRQEVTEHGRGEELPDTGSEKISGGVGTLAGSGEGSKIERVERRIKETLRRTADRRIQTASTRTGRVENKETRESFEDRVRSEGYTYAEFGNGKLAVGFKVAPKTKWNTNAKNAAAKLEGLGLDVVVFDGLMHTNQKGVSDISDAGQRSGR